MSYDRNEGDYQEDYLELENEFGVWSKEKCAAFREDFLDFLNYVKVNSKELGQIILGEHIYRAQLMMLDGILDALSKGIHDIKILKSRQLGISTFSRAFTLFWNGMHHGLHGYVTLDSGEHREEARLELLTMIRNLPASLGFPGIKRENRSLLELGNESVMNFAAAGVRESKSSGTLGRSSGISFAHNCMAPDTPVIIGDGWIKSIADVVPGDRVVTHSGAMATVLANKCIPNDCGPMLSIQPWLGMAVKCTRDHKIATARGLVPAGELALSDVLVMPIRPITAEAPNFTLSVTENRRHGGGSISAGSGAAVTIDRELGFAIGYYLAEGCMTYQRRGEDYGKDPAGIIFTRHRTETDYADRACSVLAGYTTGSRRTIDKPNSLTSTEHVYGAAIARWIKSHFGSTDTKCIPDEVFSWGREFCDGLLHGLLCGDGSKQMITMQGYKQNRVNLVSTRASIAMQARDLAASLGYGWASIRSRKAGQFYGRNCREIWIVDWHSTAAAKLRVAIGLDTVPVRRPWIEKYRIVRNAVHIRIKGIQDGIIEPIMHDLAVDHDDHTFRTTSMAVSNSEMCSWQSSEGIESYKAAFAEDNPNRLYIWESTARGFNLWNDMWVEAKADPAHQYTIFLGWWSKDSQQISRKHPDFETYGRQPPTENELKKIKAVKDQYGWDITPEQLAWVRRKMDPTAKTEGDATPDFEGSTLKIQEQPWTEEEAFQITGATFFEPVDLTNIANKHVSPRFQTYSFTPGLEFTACRVHKAHNARSVQLKIWEEPDPDGVYVLAADPAFGSNENNDRSAIQVLRCYADCVEQVAEYAWPLINTRQFAWVIAALLGYYAECYFILELNGPGNAVLQEFQSLRHQLERGYQRAEAQEKGLANILGNVKQYLYTRVDSMSAGRNLHFKTTGPLKVLVMERLRDFVGNNKVILRSMDTVEEMKAITREGDSIEAAGSKKDDRVMALALGIHIWEQRVRKGMSSMNRTREFEISKKRMTITDQAAMFQSNQLSAFFAGKANLRKRAAISANRDAWRRGVRR